MGIEDQTLASEDGLMNLEDFAESILAGKPLMSALPDASDSCLKAKIP